MDGVKEDCSHLGWMDGWSPGLWVCVMVEEPALQNGLLIPTPHCQSSPSEVPNLSEGVQVRFDVVRRHVYRRNELN